MPPPSSPPIGWPTLCCSPSWATGSRPSFAKLPAGSNPSRTVVCTAACTEKPVPESPGPWKASAQGVEQLQRFARRELVGIDFAQRLLDFRLLDFRDAAGRPRRGCSKQRQIVGKPAHRARLLAFLQGGQHFLGTHH